MRRQQWNCIQSRGPSPTELEGLEMTALLPLSDRVDLGITRAYCQQLPRYRAVDADLRGLYYTHLLYLLVDCCRDTWHGF